MKKMMLLLVGILLAGGCGYVSQTELQESQNELRSELHSEFQTELNEASFAAVECSTVLDTVGRALQHCEHNGMYCSAVEAFIAHCERRSDDDQPLAPLPGVIDAVKNAVEQDNARFAR